MTGTFKPIALGVNLPDFPNDPARIDAYGALVGSQPRIVMWYQTWTEQYNTFWAGVDVVLAHGAVPLITWEPWAGNITDPAWTLASIISGAHDAYIDQWTKACAAWGKPIYVKLMHEMNGWWYPWCPGVNGNTAVQFVSAWQHIVKRACVNGARNIRWVWSPNVNDGNAKYTPFAPLYPGDSYVDWVGLDGYNADNPWVEMYDLFHASVVALGAITSKPLMIAEMASTEVGGSKAKWILVGFAQLLLEMPSVRAVIWFNRIKEADWRVDSSPDSLAAFRIVATSSLFSGEMA